MPSLIRKIRNKVKVSRGMPDKWLYAAGIRRAGDLALPDFMGIGVMKAGTRWLYECLSRHPDLHLTSPKELHYFDWHYDQPLRTYSRNYLADTERKQGEITPSYSCIPRSRIRFIRRVMPEVRLILILRNPIERAWSHARMTLASRGKKILHEIRDEEFVRQFRSEESIRRGNYPRILSNWRSVFPAGQLHIALFEEIRERPREMLAEVFEFIGVRADCDWERVPYRQVIHKGIDIEFPSQYREFLGRMYRDDIEFLHQELGDRVAHWRIA